MSLCEFVASRPPSSSSSVILGTALVHVRGRSGSWQIMHGFIDSTSQISVTTASCADKLGLNRTGCITTVTGLSGVPVFDVQGRIECTVQPHYANEPVLSIHVWVLPSITGDLPRKSLPLSVLNQYSNRALANPSSNTKSPIDILLG